MAKEGSAQHVASTTRCIRDGANISRIICERTLHGDQPINDGSKIASEVKSSIYLSWTFA